MTPLELQRARLIAHADQAAAAIERGDRLGCANCPELIDPAEGFVVLDYAPEAGKVRTAVVHPRCDDQP